MRDVAITVGGSAAATMLAIAIGNTDGRMPWPAVATMLVVVAVGFAASSRVAQRFVRSLLAELQLGYATTTPTGAFWMGGRPHVTWMRGSIEWDWRGTWLLTGGGEVKSAPSDEVDPPGLYPSPHRDGLLELWTGHEWAGYFCDPASRDRVR